MNVSDSRLRLLPARKPEEVQGYLEVDLTLEDLADYIKEDAAAFELWLLARPGFKDSARGIAIRDVEIEDSHVDNDRRRLVVRTRVAEFSAA